MIFQKYIMKEIVHALIATVLVLLGIVLSQRLILYLSQAANGTLSQRAILNLLGLQLLRFFTELLPLSFMLATLLALGRLYRDVEMTAMFALSFSLRKLYQTLLLVALPITFLLLVMNFIVLPYTFGLQYSLQRQAQNEAQLTIFKAGVFRELLNGSQVVYVGSLDNDSRQLKDIFIRSLDEKGLPAVTLAKQGEQKIDDEGQRFLILNDGVRYQKTDKNEDYVLTFSQMELKLDRVNTVTAPEAKALPFKELISQLFSVTDNQKFQAEIQRRIAAPISVLILILMIPMLAHARPREGRFNRLISGVVVYVLYFNLLGISEAWLKKGLIPSWLGLWWVHILFLSLGLLVKYWRGRKI